MHHTTAYGPTERLYFDDSFLREFRAVVAAHSQIDRRPAVALDRSAFYPEGGGQPADQGMLNRVPIVDVQADDAGVVWHELGRPEDLTLLPVGATVQGAINWKRRFDHMQQHCGQHILTAAFIATCGLPTLSFHLSPASVTIDLDTPALSEEQARATEELANRVVWENRPVTARVVDPAELATLPLRKPPSVIGAVRVVTVADFDYSACGGTHPGATGGVGMISVRRWSRQGRAIRVEFACGGRALRALQQLDTAAGEAAAMLSVGVGELPPATERLLAAQKAQFKELEQARAELTRLEAERLYTTGEQIGPARVVRTIIPGASIERLRSMAQAIAALAGGVAILGAAGERAQLVAACAPDSGQDARTLLAAGLPHVGGRGGGSPQLAQGAGPAVDGLEAALDAMFATARRKD